MPAISYKKSMRPTIRSIAKAAGVSRGTVDRVLNNRPGVSPDVRERVNKIAANLGYIPNLAGKALAFQKNPIKIGFIILNVNDPFCLEIQEGVEQISKELKGFGIQVECCFMCAADVQEQLECIRELKSRGISALAISPLDEEVIKNELKILARENVKIVTYNTDIAGVEKLCFVGQELKKSGRVAGDLIGKLLPNGGNVLVIAGKEKLRALRERVDGFKEVLEEEYPEVKIIKVLKNVHDNETSYIHTMKVLKEQVHINAIYITSYGVGGVGRALKEMNRRDVKLVCYDKIPETVELIKERIVDFTITQEPFMQGYLPVKILYEYLFHNKLPEDKQIYTKLEIITIENTS